MTKSSTFCVNCFIARHVIISNQPFSCSVINICKAMAASTRTGKSLSLHRAFLHSSKACRKLFSFLNFNSQKCLTTQQACKKISKIHFHITCNWKCFMDNYLLLNETNVVIFVWCKLKHFIYAFIIELVHFPYFYLNMEKKLYNVKTLEIMITQVFTSSGS